MIFNKNLIIICISLIWLTCFIQAIQEPKIYHKFGLDYNEGTINLNFSEIEITSKNLENGFGFYTAESLNYEGERINTIFFDIPKEILWDGINLETGNIENGGIIKFEQLSFEIYVPYYESAKEIIIYDEQLNEALRIDVSMYSKYYKKNLSLIDDEGSLLKESDGDDEIVSEEIIETKGNEKNLSERLIEYWWILLIIFLILLVILFISLRKPNM